MVMEREGVEALRRENESLLAEVNVLRPRAKRAAELERENEALCEQIAWFRRYFLHRKTDAVEDDSQQPLPFDEAEQLSEPNGGNEKHQETEVGSYRRRSPVRKPLPDDIPRVTQIIDIADEEKQCGCGHELTKIGEEKSEKLDIEPPRLRVIQQIRPKYACRHCEGSGDEDHPAVRIAPVPPTLIPGGIATPGLLAYVVTSKFVDGMPLYRQEKQFERMGVDLSRQTMADWMIASANACEPVMEELKRQLRSGPVMQIDETRVQVMNEPGRENATDSYAWAAVGGEPDHPVVLFRYEPTRSGKVALQILDGFTGYAQTDAYGGYGWSIASLAEVTHVGCMAHLRRKFSDAANDGKNSSSAREALSIIGKIYAVEKELSAWPRDGTFRDERERRVRPFVEKLRTWLEKKVAQLPPRTALGRAVNYAVEQLPRVVRYLECEHLTPDTNRVENAIRPFVLGRKNWLFSGSPRGADASMTLYSLVETAKANRVEPYWYLRRLFDRLPSTMPDNGYQHLLPWNLKAEQRAS